MEGSRADRPRAGAGRPTPLRFKNCPLVGLFRPSSCWAATASLQYFDVQYVDDRGGQPSFVKDLPETTRPIAGGQGRLSAGLQRYEEQQRRYQGRSGARPRANRRAEPGVKEIIIPQAKIAPRSDPKHLKLTPLWKCTDVKKPGNILVVPGFGGAPRLAIIDSWNVDRRSGAQRQAAGPAQARHPETRKRSAICAPRSAADGKRLFAGFAIGQQRAHLFDENWNLLASYPADALENRHSGIADVQLADLEGDGKLRLYVGYLGVVGLQAASLEGKRLAFNRLLNNAHMAIGPAEKGRRNLDLHQQPRIAGGGGFPAPGPRRRHRSPGGRCSGSSPPTWRATASCVSAAWRARRRTSARHVAVGLNLKGRAVVELRPSPRRPAAAHRTDHRRQAHQRSARANGSCPAPTARSTFSTPTASCVDQFQLRRGAVRPGHGGDRRQAGAGGGHARRRRGLAGGVKAGLGGLGTEGGKGDCVASAVGCTHLILV